MQYSISFREDLLGENATNRINEFREYQKGWDFGSGLKLNNLSISCMNLFLNNIDSFCSEPSVFLTRKGNLQLAWNNIGGCLTEIEFFPQKLEYFIENSIKDVESSCRRYDLYGLINKLWIYEFIERKSYG